MAECFEKVCSAESQRAGAKLSVSCSQNDNSQNVVTQHGGGFGLPNFRREGVPMLLISLLRSLRRRSRI